MQHISRNGKNSKCGMRNFHLRQNIGSRFFRFVTRHACRRVTDRRTDRITVRQQSQVRASIRRVVKIVTLCTGLYRATIFLPAAKSPLALTLRSRCIVGYVPLYTSSIGQINQSIIVDFYCATNGSADLGVVVIIVRPWAVCPPHACFVIKRKIYCWFTRYFDFTWKGNPSGFLTPTMV